MERKVVIDQWQKVTTEDFNNFGNFPRASFDNLNEDCGPGRKFSGFSTVQTTNTKITVGEGRLYEQDGKIYYNSDAGGVEIDFLGHTPVATYRYATIVAWGQEILTETNSRTFITDSRTRATEARAKSTESRRHCNLQVAYGLESIDPERPAIASNVLAICSVLLDSSGIVSIQMEEDNRVRGLAVVNSDLLALNIWKAIIGTRIDTLASELQALAARINGLTPMAAFIQSVSDIARLKEKADLPDTYSAWASDPFLDEQETDTLNVDYLARIEEGLRFAHASERIATLSLNNPNDASVKVTDNFVLPVYTEVRRLGNVAVAKTNVLYETSYYTYRIPELVSYWWNNQYYFTTEYRLIHESYTTATTVTTPPDEISISQYATQTIPCTFYSRVRWRVRWGCQYFVTSRINAWWDKLHDPVYVTFHRRVADTSFVALVGPPYTTVVYAPPAFVWRQKWYRSRWYWKDWVVDYHYWDRQHTTNSVNGSVVAQTFLNSQDGWLTAIHLFFTRRGAAGNVTVLICETTETGQPNVGAVIGYGTLARDHIQIWPKTSRVEFPPVFLAQGKRYAFVPVTTGAHFLATTERNQYINGTLFYSTDQVWFQGVGDMSRDLAFELVFAEFSGNRTYVTLNPLELDGGIAGIDINTDGQEPEGTNITFEVLLNGVWTPLSEPTPDSNDPPLIGLPTLLQLRACLSGTQSVMPGFSVGSNSEAYTWRPRSDVTHISTVRSMPVGGVDTVTVSLRIEAWRGAPYHTCTVALLNGPTFTNVVTAAAVVDEDATDDANAIIRHVSFTGLTDEDAYKIKITGTTDNVITCWHGSERLDIGIAAP